MIKCLRNPIDVEEYSFEIFSDNKIYPSVVSFYLSIILEFTAIPAEIIIIFALNKNSLKVSIN